MNDPAALRLGDRTGLPDDIAFLSADYLHGHWRAHAIIGQLTDLRLQVQTKLRNKPQFQYGAKHALHCWIQSSD